MPKADALVTPLVRLACIVLGVIEETLVRLDSFAVHMGFGSVNSKITLIAKNTDTSDKNLGVFAVFNLWWEPKANDRRRDVLCELANEDF